MSYQIRRLGIGGILDQGIAIVRNHFGLLFSILLYAWIPFQLLSFGLQLLITPSLGPNPTEEDIARVISAQMQYLPITMALAVIGGVVILSLTNAAVMYAVAEKYLGRNVTAGEAIRFGLGKIGPLVWTSILVYFAIVFGLILLIIPGILFALWYGLSQNVVVLENLSGLAAMRRSKELVRPYLGTFLVLGLVVGLISFLLGAGAALIPQEHVKSLVVIVIQGFVTLLSTAVMVIFYFSCRCALENFDLEHLAAAVEQSASAQPATADEF